MACVTACPSGVQYDKLIEDARPQLERNFERPPLERAHRRLIFELFTRPGRLRALAPGAALAQKLGLPRLARRPRVRRLAPRLAAMISMTPEASLERSLSRLPERFEARGEKRGTVALLQGCVQRVFFAHVNEATARVLAAEGFEVHVPRQPRCCGALPMHAGEDVEARALAKATIEELERFDTVVVNAAGCGSAMKDYGHVLRDEPEWADRAAAFSARVRDVSEFLAHAGPRAERRPIEMKVAYHDACHLAHAQGVRAQPRELLRGIPGHRAGRAGRLGALLRLRRHLQPGAAGARIPAGRAQGAQPLGHGSRGRRGGEPGMRAPDHGAHRAPRTPAPSPAPDGAARPLNRVTAPRQLSAQGGKSWSFVSFVSAFTQGRRTSSSVL